MRILRLSVVPLALVLAACATTPPTSTSTPAMPAVSTPAVTPTTDTTTTATVSPDDEGSDLVLRGDGLATYPFGSPQAGVAQLLSDQLGAPDETSQGILCELDDSSPWAETVTYGGLWVQYSADDRKKSSQRKLSAWGFSLSEELTSPLKVEDDVPLNLSYAELKAAYPKGKLKDLGFGDGQKMFTLPNQMFFVGGTKKPLTLQAGELSVCE